VFPCNLADSTTIREADELYHAPDSAEDHVLPGLVSAAHGRGGWDIGSRFGHRLRELRRAHQMRQIDLAVLLGIDRSYLSEVECGKKGISLATLEVIALGFRLRLSDLLRDL